MHVPVGIDRHPHASGKQKERPQASQPRCTQASEFGPRYRESACPQPIMVKVCTAQRIRPCQTAGHWHVARRQATIDDAPGISANMLVQPAGSTYYDEPKGQPSRRLGSLGESSKSAPSLAGCFPLFEPWARGTCRAPRPPLSSRSRPSATAGLQAICSNAHRAHLAGFRSSRRFGLPKCPHIASCSGSSSAPNS
jgi:hypothetical protein